MEFFSFYKIFFQGLRFQSHKVYEFALYFFIKSPVSERLQLVGTVLGIISILTSWSGYTLQFTEKHTYTHFIYTDDFLLYFLLFSITAGSVLLSRYWDVSALKILNLISTLLIFALAFRQLWNMATLVPVGIAELNPGFFLFFLAIVMNGAGLALGIIAKPRAP